jgi:hypothetical protein
MTSWKTALGLMAPALLIAACGYPDFGFTPIGSGSSTGDGGKASTSTSSVSSTASSSTATTATAATATSSTGMGGACPTTGDSTCVFLPDQHCGCGETQKCAVTNDGSGQATCIQAGTLHAWNKCNSNSDCDADTFCDEAKHVCRTVCVSASQCPTNAQCAPATKDGVTPIKGLSLCTAHCDPSIGGPCGPGTTCVYDSGLVDFDCAVTKNLDVDTGCNDSAECAKGLVCAPYMGNAAFPKTCKRWCSPPDNSVNGACPGQDPYCDSIGVQISFEGTPYGACDPP